MIPPPNALPLGLPPRQSTATDPNSPATTPGASPESTAGKSRTSPPEMMADALVPRQGSGLAGRAFTLTNALAVSPDPRQRLETARTYWRLVEAVASYHYAHDHRRQLEAVAAGQSLPSLLKTARVSAAAAVQEAELAALTVQHELATLCLFPPGLPLPLPADRPHVGPYRTAFAELFAASPAPPRARLIDQVLPYLRRAIDVRAAGAEAAEEAFRAASAGQNMGQADLSTTLLCLAEWTRQRRAFVQVVCQYNDRIAEYAILTYPTASPQSLVTMLIDPVRDPVQPMSYQNQSPAGAASTPAGGTPGMPPLILPPPGARRPTRAVPPQTATGIGTSAPWAGKETTTPPAPATVPEKQPASSVPASPGISPGPANPNAPRALVPVVPSAPATLDTPAQGGRAVRRPIQPGTASLPEPGSYGRLAGLAAQTQATELATMLHANQALPEGIGDPLSLAMALEGRTPLERGAVITAYWDAAGRAAEYRVLSRQAEALRTLARDSDPQQEQRWEGRRLRVLQLATEAAMLEGRVAVVDAEFALATRTAREQQARWPLPNTVPWAGAYAAPPSASPSRGVEKMSGLLALQYAALTNRAMAVVAADQTRSDAAGRSEKNGAGLARALANLGQETDETLSFLQLLGQYNDNIGQYVLTVAPAGASGAQLAAAMIPTAGLGANPPAGR